jgi:hypothetical protein
VSGREDPVDAGEELLAQPAASGRRRVAYAFGVVLLGIGVAVGLLTSGHGDHHRAQPPPRPSTASPRPGPSAVQTVLPVPGPLPDVGDLRLFARAGDAVIELDFGTGQIRSTPVPGLQLTGAVTFGATTAGVFVRPAAGAPGYYVPDLGPARALAGALADATVLPAPDPNEVWTIDYRTDWLTDLQLVRVRTGSPTAQLLRVPRRVGVMPRPPAPDGSGYVLATGTGGSFDVRPGGAYRLPVDLAASTILASGSDRLLVAGCAPRSPRACPAQLLALPAGHRLAALAGLTATAAQPAGVISPDRRTALIYQAGASGLPQARLLDLTTGRPRGAAVAVDPGVQPGALAYSPDGRWAFAIGTAGKLIAIDVRTGAARRVDGQLPFLYQLATMGGSVTSPDSTIRMYLQTNSYERIGACSSPRPTTPTHSSNASHWRC